MKRHHRGTKGQKKRWKKTASHNPNYLNDVASSVYRHVKPRDTLGAASPVRIIMKDGKLV